MSEFNMYYVEDDYFSPPYNHRLLITPKKVIPVGNGLDRSSKSLGVIEEIARWQFILKVELYIQPKTRIRLYLDEIAECNLCRAVAFNCQDCIFLKLYKYKCFHHPLHKKALRVYGENPIKISGNKRVLFIQDILAELHRALSHI